MDRIYTAPEIFKARALEEIRRAKRYPTFVSLVTLDLSHLSSEAELENFKTLDDFVSSLRILVRNSIRETDLVGISGQRCILILLVETPKEGAEAVASRLQGTVKYFLVNNIKSPISWRVPMKEYHFPAGDNDKASILTVLEEIDG